MRAVVLNIALALAAATASGADFDGSSFPNDSAQSVRLDRRNVPGGAQLITLFVPAPFDLAPAYPGGIPIVSYLKDTLGDTDPANDRIRQVWVLTAGKQSHVRRALNALPFVSFGRDEGTTSGMPFASVDLGDPAHDTWSNIAQVVIQGQVLDPTGMALRTSSRAYAWNAQSRDDLNVYEAVSLLPRLDTQSLPEDVSADVRAMHARLLLSRRTLGGLVRDRRLDRVYDSDETNRDLARAHNWELVRQEAEANGLYFEPVSFGDPQPSHALVWVRRSDIAKAARPYDSGLLKIASPWGDERLMDWKGYSETWRFDADGSRTEDQSAASDQVIPLALYALNYPRVPLLVVDFRSSGAPRRRETAARIAQNVTRGVLGFSPIANWNYFAAQWAWDWLQRRHGAANDRPARLRTYAETSYLLSMDESLRGPLRAELKHRLQDSSPLLSRRAHIAASQFETLARVDNSGGVRRVLDHDRQSELTSYAHGPFARFGLTLAHVGTFGLYRHTENQDFPLAALDIQRRIAYHKRVLEAALDRNVPLGNDTGAPAIRASITGLMELSYSIRNTAGVRLLIDRVMARSEDEALRAACTRAIEALRTFREPALVAGSKKQECGNCRGSVAAVVPAAAPKLAVGGTR